VCACCAHLSINLAREFPINRQRCATAAAVLALTAGAARPQARADILESLGEAGNYAVYGIGVTMTPVTGGGTSLITGNVAIGNTGPLTLGGGSEINGNVVLGIGATSSTSGGTVTGTTTTGHDFAAADVALQAASTGYDS
jgi:hypothetical protein